MKNRPMMAPLLFGVLCAGILTGCLITLSLSQLLRDECYEVRSMQRITPTVLPMYNTLLNRTDTFYIYRVNPYLQHP